MKVSELWLVIRYKLGWAAIILLTLIPSMRALALNLQNGGLGDTFALFSLLGQITGIAGMLLYSINLILAVRLRIMEDYFGGLNRMYIAHHLTGGIALIFLSFHPVLLSLRYFSKVTLKAFHLAAQFLWVHPISLTSPITNDMAINFGIVALLGMVVLLVLTFFIHLPYRIWLFTHKFLGAAFFFAGLHILFVKGTVSDDPFLKWYLLTFAAVGLVSAAYRTLGGRILVRRYNYHVESVKLIGKDVIELILEPVDKILRFDPGQFIFIRFFFSGVKGVTSEAHPFSVASSPSEDKLKLCVKVLGDYTKDLLQLKPGAIAEIEGAYGKFSYKNYDNPNQVWIAGGIGITPFISMAKSLTVETPLNVDLYYSVKREVEMVDYPALEKLTMNKNLHFRLIPHIADVQGFLTADIIEKRSSSLEGKDFYICGPPVMMKTMRKQLQQKGVPNWRIHSEEFAMT